MKSNIINFITSDIVNKFIIKSFTYLCILLSLIYFLVEILGFKNLFVSKLNPNYWITALNNESYPKNYDYLIINLLQISKQNKYKSKSLINFIYHYDKFTDEAKRESLDLLQ